jgi:16S rRNA C967 or C1407 C5-methylase (RsmB/RsmF family)
MYQRPFREHHILRLLEEYEIQKLPLDIHIKDYFRAHKALGSKDRAEIAETVYHMIRWLGLIDYLCEKSLTWENRYELFKISDFAKYSERPGIPDHIRVSFPKVLYDLIIDSHGSKLGEKLCLDCNYPAPTTIRINPLKTTRDKMFARWKNEYDISTCRFSEFGIVFHKKINFFSLPEFKAGLFEVQDEGSQLLADLIQVEPGQHVMDYCSGSGGKTLAFAHKMQNKGQIFLHDIRSYILAESKKRLKRAGIQNAQLVQYDHPKLQKLKKKMDWILVDAPCTGTGTLRRNPDMKWKFTDETLPRLTGQQKVIFEKALSFLKPGGKIVYGTCSILNQENEAQIQHFLETYDLELVQDPFKSLPQRNSMDGFFGAVMEKRKSKR